MGRSRRVEEPFGFYHLTSRGSDRQRIFVRPADRLDFLRLLEETIVLFGWSCLAYCLMTNHYHLVVQIADGGLSRGMQRLNGGFSRLFNIKHACSAHLFRNRFGDVFIEDERQLIEACRYVVLNPVRAGLCRRPEEWPWSSYHASAGLVPAPALLADTDLISLFGYPEQRGREAYVAFVEEGRAAAVAATDSVSDTVADRPQASDDGVQSAP